jgi:hypothetical protein
MRLSSQSMDHDHNITIPAHKQLRIGTLAEILGDVANYPELTREELARKLFEL